MLKVTGLSRISTALPEADGGMAPYKSAFDRLKELPAFFSLNTLVRQSGMSRETASVALKRWATKGWVTPAGPRSGAYFNLIADPGAADSQRISAILHEYPSALLAAESVLHSAGWITQIPSALSVFVETRRSYVSLTGVTIEGRSLAWFRAMSARGAIQKNGTNDINAYGLRFLEPAWALADMYASAGAWHPDEDDLDVPDDKAEELLLACQAMGVVPDWLQEQGANQYPREGSR